MTRRMVPFVGATSLLALFMVVSCGTKKPVASSTTTPWVPGVSYAMSQSPVYRGLVDRRGLIHAHNVHSHDACADDGAAVSSVGDGNPALSLASNISCFNEFRTDVCAAQHDFVFLSDHPDRFVTTDYPDQAGIAANTSNQWFLKGDNAMLYTQTMDTAYMSKADQLIQRNNSPVANRATCADGHIVLLIPGNEGNNLMPVGLEQHVGDQSARSTTYGTNTEQPTPDSDDKVNAAIATDKANGAVVLMAHPEDMSEQQLATYPIDGFEMYNVHNNALLYHPGFALVLNLIAAVNDNDVSQIPKNPNLLLMSFVLENPDYLSRWAYALSSGAKRVTTMGSDCHQNAIPVTMSDGEWGDGYRRVMEWFSNHLLVKPNADGSWDDLNLKEALRNGRAYGVFEMLGYPVGFDYHATVGTTVSEMGDEVQLTSGPTLSVKLPSIENLDPKRIKPQFTVRILRANGEAWDEVAKGSGDLNFTPTQPGAYRAEIREIPYHLKEDLGPVATIYLAHDYVWIYSNAIYVR